MRITFGEGVWDPLLFLATILQEQLYGRHDNLRTKCDDDEVVDMAFMSRQLPLDASCSWMPCAIIHLVPSLSWNSWLVQQVHYNSTILEPFIGKIVLPIRILRKV